MGERIEANCQHYKLHRSAQQGRVDRSIGEMIVKGGTIRAFPA